MTIKPDNDSDIKNILFRQGKVIGHLEELQKSIVSLDNKIDKHYEATITDIKEVLVKCEENSLKNIEKHAESCPLIDKFNIHLVKHSEKDKYKKENEIRQESNKSNKITWFKWLISVILGILGIKGIWDIIFHNSSKINQHIDKIIR